MPHDVALVLAPNPGPFTLEGTNTWVLGRDPCWVVDPGPAIPAHLAAVVAEVAARGGARGIALTHDHADHAEGLPALAERLGGPPVLAARYPGAQRSAEPGTGLEAIPTPGHAPDHLAFLTPDGILFSGDAVLGRGSVFVWPDPGALSGYLAALRGLQARELTLLCPGHGPQGEDPRARIAEYLAHRAAREERLVAALGAGHRSIEALLDAAWSEVPAVLRPAAAVTLAAHLDKLAEEERLPVGVERPAVGTPLAL